MMANNINLLDRAPQVIIRGLNWVLAPFEDPVGLDRPRWMDSSRYQGEQDFLVQAANGVWGNVFRMGISWGYQDPMFAINWGESKGRLRYRSSYHVLYPDQLVQPQFDNWIKHHPQIDVIPRVIDLELQNNTSPAVIANQAWEMSERVADHDGVRPIIYSRRNLINEWLVPYWSGAMLNEHYYHLAQYLWDRTREHPGPPTLPNGVDRSRVLIHQTADKKSTPADEAESLSVDWDRWEIGNADQMVEWIKTTWGGGVVEPDPEPEPDTELIQRVITLENKVSEIESWIVAHDEQPAGVDAISVMAREGFALAVVVGHDKACEGADPQGKPILEPPKENRVVINAGEVFTVKARAAYSCKDDPDTPEILATGGVPYYVRADGQAGAGQFVRADKVKRVNG